MKIVLLVLIIYILNGCGRNNNELVPCKPVPCTQQKQSFVKLPTYKTPVSRPFKVVKDLGDGTSIVRNVDLLEVVANIDKYKKICWRYASVNIRLNKRGAK